MEQPQVQAEYVAVAQTNTLLTLLLSLYPTEQGGQVFGSSAFGKYIIERKRADDALAEAHRRIAATVAAIPDLMFEADVKGRIYAYHAPATEALYAQPEAFLGKMVEDVLPPNAAGLVLKALTQAATEGSHRGATYALDMPGGRRWFELSIAQRARPAPDARFVALVRDITERRHAEEAKEREIAQLRLELTHLARVVMVNEISASLAHEINQPLCAILNNAEAAKTLLSQAQDRLEAIPEIIDDISEAAKRAGDIVHKLRKLMKKGDALFEPLPINDVIDDALKLLHSSLAMNKVTLRLDLKPDLPNINGDRVRLQQVLLNLVTNALDSMKETPSRILTVRSVMDAPDMITVSVSDSGPGIAEARRALVFQPFFTTKKDGLGLGLSICRSIIEEHGGRIWAGDNLGGGATFSFSLKVWIQEAAQAPA